MKEIEQFARHFVKINLIKVNEKKLGAVSYKST